MDGPYRTSRSESISSAASSAPALVDSPQPEQQQGHVSGGSFPQDDPEGMSEEVRVAIAALGIMKRGGSSSSSSTGVGGAATVNASRSASTASNASYSWSHSGPTDSTAASSPRPPTSLAPTESDEGEWQDREAAATSRGSAAAAEVNDPRFIERVSQLPIVSGGLEWYGHAKASSRVIGYGAGLVESSISAVSRPIANQLGPLDDFACRQLDRLGAAGGGSPLHGAAQQQDYSSNGGSRPSPIAYGEPGYWEQRERERQAHAEAEAARNRRVEEEERAIAVGGRSRWQTVLVEAGGLGAAVSEESLKSLRYCLQWLLYATAHLDHQINTLRDFIVSLQHHNSSGSPSSNALVTASASAHLSQIKHDVVETIRKVVEVVSKYAGVALPEQAKRYVRQSILGLPVKWASAIEEGRDARGATPGQGAVLGRTEDAADRVLTFAVESLDMLKSVTGIFGESVQKAEDWIERLRIVGLDRQRQRQASGSMPPPLPFGTEDQSLTGTKRRRAIARDSDDGESAATGVELNGVGGEETGVARRKKGARNEVA